MPRNPDPQYKWLVERFKQTHADEQQLYEDYREKRRGTNFYTRQRIFLDKREQIKAKIQNLGTYCNLVVVTGKRKVTVGNSLEAIQEFRAYYTDINPEDALLIAKNTIEGFLEGEANNQIELGIPL